MSDRIVRVSLRLPEWLWEELQQVASDEHRSLHAQIMHMLIAALRERRNQG